MNRRGFFKALVATAVIAAATSTRLGQTVFDVVKSGYRYVLHGDGVTDDTEALQALLDGEEVFTKEGRLLGDIPSSAYRVSSALEITRRTVLRGVRINYRGDPSKPVIILSGAQGVLIDDVYMEYVDGFYPSPRPLQNLSFTGA